MDSVVDWMYRGEGNSNLVVAYVGPQREYVSCSGCALVCADRSPKRGHVLRLRKARKGLVRV